ncbi:Rpn family recombination-promoting nuclease/putative transposase [Treponema vincentii]|uniref:Rpn family recombination-promoting nuclease/putative transposase n=2 Tax=Treponema vincentii TaxID=69710 RepID=UPI0020A242F7|nr:Rpn family recombination-promoting nuclease/putative transposase [Treponema vincentii]UTC45759.1 Rpn family recombination-promoting nuclease/putative transposase [Treponema vincentii]
MTQKPFEDLTIADDFMFCKVMEYEPICKEFLEMLFNAKIEKITYLSSQNTVTANSGAKTVRLDVLVKDKAGTSYDIEMQVGNEYNIPKRMRYYQAVLDVAFLDKGYSYKALNESYIIFICLFDPIGSNRAVYTFENICIEDKRLPLQDGTKKIILNANSFRTADNKELQGFLQYVKTGKVTTAYTGRIEQMIQTVKRNEQLRKEYHILPAVLMDAFDEGEARGKSLGLAEGEARGRSEGSHQAKLETAKNLLQFGLSREKIAQATGLTQAEVEAIK